MGRSNILPTTRFARCFVGVISFFLASSAFPVQRTPVTEALERAIVYRGDSQAPECRDALLLAKSMPSLRAPDPSLPIVVPVGMASTLYLGRPPEASKPGVLSASREFKSIPLSDGDFAYWAEQVEVGKRIAVVTSPRASGGKFYSLYLLDPTKSFGDFRDLALSQRIRTSTEHFYTDTVSPLLFKLPANGGTWLLEIAPQENKVQAWRIYSKPLTRHVCTINVLYKGEVAPPHTIQD